MEGVAFFKVKPWQCPWRHPEGEGGTTAGFPPSLSKDNRKLNIEYYQFVAHGTQEILQSVSKKVKAWCQNNRKSMPGPQF